MLTLGDTRGVTACTQGVSPQGEENPLSAPRTGGKTPLSAPGLLPLSTGGKIPLSAPELLYPEEKTLYLPLSCSDPSTGGKSSLSFPRLLRPQNRKKKNPFICPWTAQSPEQEENSLYLLLSCSEPGLSPCCPGCHTWQPQQSLVHAREWEGLEKGTLGHPEPLAGCAHPPLPQAGVLGFFFPQAEAGPRSGGAQRGWWQ